MELKYGICTIYTKSQEFKIPDVLECVDMIGEIENVTATRRALSQLFTYAYEKNIAVLYPLPGGYAAFGSVRVRYKDSTSLELSIEPLPDDFDIAQEIHNQQEQREDLRNHHKRTDEYAFTRSK